MAVYTCSGGGMGDRCGCNGCAVASHGDEMVESRVITVTPRLYFFNRDLRSCIAVVLPRPALRLRVTGT